MNEKLFFDIHCHAMNLSHPNLLALIKHSPLQLLSMFMPFLGQIFTFAKRARNLLAIMENEIGGMFLIVEYYLKNKGIVQNDTLTINGNIYNTIVLTPLLMDFGYKNMDSDVYYNIPLEKPIVEQTLDVFNGIRRYCDYELVEITLGDYQIQKRQSKAIFEIYPFLGINTKNYTDQEINLMLDKYFGGYSGSYDALKANLGKFHGDIDSLGSNFFAGVKVYPPMGFDPWPETNQEARQKVMVLYQYCCAKNIPVTSHCSQIGFNLDKNYNSYTSPKKWQKVLENYPNLKLNLAHFGEQTKILFIFKNQEWQDDIVNLLKNDKYPNVYTDFSFRAFDEDYYSSLKKIFGTDRKLLNRILFGSDFMINLLCIDSYNDYINIFKNTKYLKPYEKDLFCSTNPWQFLFV
jgi:Amidohydrolase